MFRFVFIWLFNVLSTVFEKRDWKKRELTIPEEELTPPMQQTITVAQKTTAMDQVFFYVLKQERIWYKPIAASTQSPWKLFGPDGLPPNDHKLTAISADGVNLLGIDESRTVYYIHSNRIYFVLTDDDWIIKNISLDWTTHWFAVPLIRSLLKLFRDHHLKIPPDCHTLAISQKGPETAY